ncbi:hypothetical protein BZG01_21275 [Labilibaculum manganireducens]|uniref:Transposase n=1 Tax=Labilibaculum manganireducens TaxID=1940525 RepID=A0A2N3HQ10_9BACT|nr:hypothetical protein BZG01_21275 [Labilibaculum manganireducens]
MRLTQEITDEIDQLLLKNQEKLSLGQRKQLLKKIDILEVLHSKGYDIGYTTVCNTVLFVNLLKKKLILVYAKNYRCRNHRK